MKVGWTAWRKALALCLGTAALLGGLGAAGRALARPDTPAASVPATTAVTLRLNEAVVIGASVSAGFGCVHACDATPPDAPAGVERQTRMCAIRFADVLAAASADPRQKPASFSSVRMFGSPEEYAERFIAGAVKKKPTLVFAVDFMFWHAYGWTTKEETRDAKFERGLKRLEQLGTDAAIVVGDLPDMRGSVMLAEEMVPKPETLARLNARLREWARSRPNVAVVPLSDFVRSALAAKPVEMAGRHWTADEAAAWIQGDGLHATPAGLAALALACMDALRQCKLVPEGTTWETDPHAVLERVTPPPASAKKETAEQAKPPVFEVK